MTTTYTFDADIVSDLYKDIYGLRPGAAFWQNWDTAQDSGRQAIWDDLLESLSRAVQQENAAQARAEHDFQCRVAGLMHLGARDFDTAIRWLHEAHDTRGDDDYLEYQLGLGYGYIQAARESANVAKELLG